MLFDHVDHEPHKISRNQTHSATRNRELVSLTTEQTDGSATRDREVASGNRFRCWGPTPVSTLYRPIIVRIVVRAYTATATAVRLYSRLMPTATLVVLR